MRKFYMMMLAVLCIASTAVASVTDGKKAVNLDVKKVQQLRDAKTLVKKEKSTNFAQSNKVASAKTIDQLAGKKLLGMRKADAEPTIEGTWTFMLGDYYFQTSEGPFNCNFEATLDDGYVYFEDPENYELPFVASYDEATGTLTFDVEYFGTVNLQGGVTAHLFQEPYVYNWDTNDLDEQTIEGVYNASAGIISFEDDNGLMWTVYEDQTASELLGYISIYDLISAVYAGEVEPIDEEQAGQWEYVGEATFVDGWVIPGYSMGGVALNPNDYPYEVELQQNVNNPNLYRLWQPYTNGNSPLTANNLSLYEGQIVFDISDPDHVIVKPGMPAGFKNSNGEFYVFGLLGWQINGFGDDYDPAKYYQLIIDFMEENGQPFDTYKDGVVTINLPVFDYSSAFSSAYSWQNSYAATITFPGGTGINGIKTVKEASNNAWYTINGVRVAQPTEKGLYIHDGKKVQVK